MRIEVERHADCRVPGTLLRDFRVDTGEQELRRVAVAQIVEPNPWEIFNPADQPSELVRQAAGVHRLAIGAGA